MIATEWPTKPFAEVADYDTGRTPARAQSSLWEQVGELIPWVTIADLTPYGVVTSTKESANQRAAETVFRGKLVPAGTLLMSFKLTIGRVATLGVPAVHNEAIISIYPRPGIDQRFLGYYLSQVDYAALQDRQIKGNTLNKAKIDQIPVPVPPEPVQKAIADVLDLIRDALRTHHEATTVASELKRVAVAAAFKHGLRGKPQQETEIGLIPESWAVTRLGDLGRVGNGSTPKKSVPEYWDGGTYPWLTSAKVYDREIVAADQYVTDRALAECHLPRIAPGAVLIAITGQGKTLGHCAVLHTEATINQHIAYVATDTARADPSFVRGYLETQYDYLRQVASAGGSTKAALTCGFLRDLPVPLPPIDEQQEIVAILDALDRKVDLHERKRLRLEELFQSVLHGLMTGGLSIEDLDLSALPAGSRQLAAVPA